MKNIDYYLAKGCDQATAAYFAAGRRKIVEAGALSCLVVISSFVRPADRF